MTTDCVFCRIVAGEIPSTRIHEDERTLAIMDVAPATRGHALVIPRAHAADLLEIDDDDLAACARTARVIAERALARLGATGVTIMQSNREAAWQTVFHYHVHVIPRYAGDPLVLPWKPAPGDADEIAEISRDYLKD